MGVAIVAAFALTLLSMRIQRRGPEQVVYSNLCGPAMDQLCYKPVLKGGYPFAYLFDKAGISVEDQLAFVEDRFVWPPFLLDWAIYTGLVLLAMRGSMWRRSRHVAGAALLLTVFR